MVFCYEYLRHHVSYNSWLGLPFFKSSDVLNHGKLFRGLALVQQYIIELIQLLTFTSCALAAPMVVDNIDVLCGCLSSVTHTAQIVAKTTDLKLLRQAFLDHFEHMDKILAKNDLLRIPGCNFKFLEYFHQESRYLRVAQRVHMFAQIVSTLLYFVPLLHVAIWGFNADMHLPIVGYSPLNTSKMPGYLASFLFQMIAFSLVNMRMVAIDYFMIDIIVLHSSQIRFLNEVMAALIRASENGKLDEKDKEHNLKIWIKQHQAAIRANQTLRSLMSGYLILEYLYAFIHTCIPAFVITSTNSWTVPQKTALFCMISSGFLVLFLLAAAGDALSTVGQIIDKTMYGGWLASWKNMQIAFFMSTCLHQRPFYLKFSSLFPLCFPTFLAFYIFYSLLQKRASLMSATDQIMPPQPYYLPGYTGYCPQLKFRCGQSTSQFSHMLLLDSEIPHSDRLVLANIKYMPTSVKESGPCGDICHACHRQICIYCPPLIPGYQGFLPRKQHFFGVSEGKAQTCAVTDFIEKRQQRRDYYDKLASANCQNRLEPKAVNCITPTLLAEIKSQLD